MTDNLFVFNRAQPKCSSLWERDAATGDVTVTFTVYNRFPQNVPLNGTPYKYRYDNVAVATWNTFNAKHGSGIVFNRNIRPSYTFTRLG